MKAVLRSKLIAMASSYHNQKKKLKVDLIFTIARLEKQHKQTCSATIYKALQVQQKKLEALEINKIQEKILYLHQKYWTGSPKVLKMLAWNVRVKQAHNMVHAIKTNVGQIFTSPSTILETFQDLYSSLY